MKKYVLFFVFFVPVFSFSQTLPSTIAYTPEQIVSEKTNKVNQQNQVGSAETDQSIFNNSKSSHGLNLASAGKSQQVGLDLHKEAEGLQSKVRQEQTDAGVSEPLGCGDRSVLSDYQRNMCTASDTLQVMGIEAIEAQSYFRDSANNSYATMEDSSAFPLDNSAASNFASDLLGLPTNTNALYSSNKPAIESFHQLYKELDEKSQYKGLRYSTKKDYFYLEGKKYSTSVLYSKEAMLKAGISKSLTEFVYKMLAKKATSAQSKVTAMLKNKKLYDGKNWNIVRHNQSSVETDSRSYGYMEEQNLKTSPQPAVGVIELSSSLVEEKTLFKDVNGIPLGLSSDDIFKIISRKYREKDRMGFFHNSSKK